MILIAVLAAACLVLLVLGFVAPRLSRKPQGKLEHGIDRADDRAQREGGLPAKMGHNSAHISRKAVDKSTETGRSARRQVD